ncbi:xylose isomerase-like protein, partial [Coniella lustricola]
LPLSLASCSIGLPRHTLHQKLEAISRAGFQGIELSFPDILAHAKELRALGQLPADLVPSSSSSSSSSPGKHNNDHDHGHDDDDDDEISDSDWPVLVHTAADIRRLCTAHNLTVLVLQPFANYEGWTDPAARAAVRDRAKGWARIMTAAGTTMLQVGATDTPAHKITASRAQLAADLAELADLLQAENPAFCLAYENWCWATHAPGWKDVWDIVQLADRANIGLCLDTFQSAGGQWGDPTTASGMLEARHLPSPDQVAAAWLASLRDLVQTVPADKIFFLQISDAYHVTPPLAPHPAPDSPDEGLRPRGRWSHDHRPLPYDGGYLPIADFTRAVLETGFRGWLSVEVFDGRWEDKYGDDLAGFAHKARESTRKLVQDA